jgi:hypothetical protein
MGLSLSLEKSVMHVSNSAHSVDLEVLVGSCRGNGLDGSPVGEGGLGIVEPVVAHVLHVVSIEVSNTLGNFRARDTTALLDHLLSDLTVSGGLALGVSHEGVVDVVARTDNFNIVHVVTVDSGEAHTAVVHLSGEDFVSEEVVSEKSTVRVGMEQSFCHSDINEISEKRVHGVVLLFGIIEVLSMLVNSEASKHMLEEHESIIVRVLYGGSIVVDNNI